MAQRKAVNDGRNSKKCASPDGSDTEDKSMFVAVRIRPLSEKEKEARHSSCCQVIDGSVVAIKKDGNASEYLKSQAGSLHEYGFDAAFPETATQNDVYEGTTKPYLQYVLKGINVTVFAYGATGAGKTHTLMGNARCDDSAAHAEAGIIPNAICDLFERIEEKRRNADIGESWTVFMNYIEVYNEQVYDLLEGTKKVLAVREDPERGVVVVAGVTEKDVLDAEEVLELLQFGNKNRATEATMANSVSSRSHAVLQVTVRYTQRTERGGEKQLESKLSLIDLAGSERASATNNRGVRLQEGASINKSLLALANCINALAAAGKVNVKYRDSKLTHLLKSSLEGNCKLIMIANVNPSNTTFEDSHNTLKYANRAKNIKLNPQVASDKRGGDGTWLERETRLRTENSELRAKVTFLERLVEDLRAQLGGNSSSSSFSSSSSSSAAAAAAAAAGAVGLHINTAHDGAEAGDNSLEVIRAHSPTVARQIKHERINHARRRSSAHIPSQEEAVGDEARVKARKNRASMCAEVLHTLLELPTNNKSKLKAPTRNSNINNCNNRRNSHDTSMDEEVDDNETDDCGPLPPTASAFKSKFIGSNQQSTPSKIPFVRKRGWEDVEAAPTFDNNAAVQEQESMGGDNSDSEDGTWKTSNNAAGLPASFAKSSIPVSVKKAPRGGASEIPTPINKRMRTGSDDSNKTRMHSPSRPQSPNRAQSPARQPQSPSRRVHKSPTVSRPQSPRQSPSRSPAQSPAAADTIDCIFSTKSPMPGKSNAASKRNSRKSRSPLADIPFSAGGSSSAVPTTQADDAGFAEGVVAKTAVAKKRRGSLLPRPRANTGTAAGAARVGVSVAAEEDQQQSQSATTEAAPRRSSRLSMQPASSAQSSIAASTKAAAAAAAVAQAAVGGAAGSTASSRRRSVAARVGDENSANGSVKTSSSSSSLSSKMMDIVHRVTGTGNNASTTNSSGASSSGTTGSAKAKKGGAIVPNAGASAVAATPSNAYDALLSAL